MNKTGTVFLHIGYWALYLLLLLVIFVMLGIQNRRSAEAIPNLFFSVIGVASILPNVISFYAFYFWLFPAFLQKKKVVLLVIAGLAVSVLSAVFAMMLIGTFTVARPFFEETVEFIGLLLPLTVVAAIHGAIALVIRGFINWYGDIKLKEELARKNHEMELSLVRAQMDPHFLFNTISNIDVLISKDAAKASEYLGKLSDMMRFATYETRAEFIPLVDELAYIEKYIALQKIRMSEPDLMSFEVGGSPVGREVAPMIFIPFIENAFKHSGRGKIEIRFDITDSEINFACVNLYNPKEESPSGIGSELIRRRLELIYPGRHDLDIKYENSEYRVRLSIA